MEDLKQNKIQDKLKQIQEYQNMLDRAQELQKALADYDKNTINKLFFEKYFTQFYTEKSEFIPKDKAIGDKITDWKGKTYTSFHFSDKQYTFDKYAKKIYLAHSEYVEVENTNKETVLNAVNTKIENIKVWLQGAQDTIAKVSKIDQDAIVKDLIAVYKKHNSPMLWTEILELYEVKYIEE